MQTADATPNFSLTSRIEFNSLECSHIAARLRRTRIHTSLHFHLLSATSGPSFVCLSFDCPLSFKYNLYITKCSVYQCTLVHLCTRTSGLWSYTRSESSWFIHSDIFDSLCSRSQVRSLASGTRVAGRHVVRVSGLRPRQLRRARALGAARAPHLHSRRPRRPARRGRRFRSICVRRPRWQSGHHHRADCRSVRAGRPPAPEHNRRDARDESVGVVRAVPSARTRSELERAAHLAPGRRRRRGHSRLLQPGAGRWSRPQPSPGSSTSTYTRTRHKSAGYMPILRVGSSLPE